MKKKWTRQRFAGWIAVGCAALAWGCRSEVDLIEGCTPSEGLTPVCTFSNPEDLALIEGSSWMLVSEFARPEQSGQLVGYRISDHRVRTLFPDGPDDGRLSSPQPMPGWGDPGCPGPPDPKLFAPHGIDANFEDRYAGIVAVVNHGGREAIEIFELGYAAGGPAVGWRGCIPLPEGVWANDVAFLPGGGLIFSNMTTPAEGVSGLWNGMRMILGADTGEIMEWSAETGLAPLNDTRANAPNGVASSHDGSEVFFSEWAAKRLVRVERGPNSRRTFVSLSFFPDNLSWARDGRLLVAGQRGRIGDLLACLDVEEGTCAVDYTVVAVDPRSLEVEVLMEHRAVVTGAVSSALQVGGEIFLGSFAADRIARGRFPRSGVPGATR